MRIWMSLSVSPRSALSCAGWSVGTPAAGGRPHEHDSRHTSRAESTRDPADPGPRTAARRAGAGRGPEKGSRGGEPVCILGSAEGTKYTRTVRTVNSFNRGVSRGSGAHPSQLRFRIGCASVLMVCVVRSSALSSEKRRRKYLSDSAIQKVCMVSSLALFSWLTFLMPE